MLNYRCSLFLQGICGLTAGENQLWSILLLRTTLFEGLGAFLVTKKKHQNHMIQVNYDLTL